MNDRIPLRNGITTSTSGRGGGLFVDPDDRRYVFNGEHALGTRLVRPPSRVTGRVIAKDSPNWQQRSKASMGVRRATIRILVVNVEVVGKESVRSRRHSLFLSPSRPSAAACSPESHVLPISLGHLLFVRYTRRHRSALFAGRGCIERPPLSGIWGDLLRHRQSEPASQGRCT
jgi:hypothetical protein